MNDIFLDVDMYARKENGIKILWTYFHTKSFLKYRDYLWKKECSTLKKALEFVEKIKQ